LQKIIIFAIKYSNIMKRILVCFLTVLLANFLWAQPGITKLDSLWIVRADWHEVKLDKGLVYRHASFKDLYGCPQQIYVLQINPRKHSLHVMVHEGRELVSGKAQANDAVAAINGTYFDMGKSARSVCYTAVDGKVTDYTKEDLGPLSNGAVMIQKKKVLIAPWNVQEEKQYYAGKKDIMVSGPLMVVDGKEIDFGKNPGSHIPSPNPRSGIVVKDKKNILFIVVDGRQPGRAHGVTIPQFAHLSRILGAKEALNLDGGGSSSLWSTFFEKGVANKPSDGRERTVSNSILVK
jgi:exopolysaccharide biosynthesis protein